MEAEPPDDVPPQADPDGLPGHPWELQPEPVIGPGAARRRLRVAITLVVIAAFVVVAGLGGSGFLIPHTPKIPPASEIPGTAASPETPEASRGARLAVVDANGALSSMAADGGSVVTYPAPGATFTFPAWSPDGRQIAAIATNADGVGIDVFEVPAVGGSADAAKTVYQSPDEPPFYLYWSPDGSRLGFLTTESDGISLRQVPADGSNVDLLVRDGAPMYWQWVDPTRLLVHSGDAPPDAFVGEVDLTGEHAEPLTATAGRFRAPSLSGNGAFRAYASGRVSGKAVVVTESRDGTMHRELPVFGSSALAFEPAGDTLAFVAAASSDAVADLPLGPLRALDPASGAVRTLLGGPVVAFFWSPDGSTIAALRVSDSGGTPALARPNGAQPDGARPDPVGVLARAAGPTSSGQAPAGTAGRVLLKVAFVDVASGSVRSERTVRPSDLFIGQVLPYFDQYALSHRFWSPDSTSIVLPLDDDQGVSRLTIIPADGSNPRVIAAGAMGSWSP